MNSSTGASRSATDLFAQLASGLLDEPRIQQGTGFDSIPGLRADKKIFAMLCRGELVVKLPRHRVDQLVDARRDGRLMKEWATIPPE